MFVLHPPLLGLIDESVELKEKALTAEGKLSEAEEYRQKLRRVIKQLKEDRNHYRALAEQTK